MSVCMNGEQIHHHIRTICEATMFSYGKNKFLIRNTKVMQQTDANISKHTRN